MPLFFFISGFFAYNANRKIDNLSSYIYEILKKGRIQLVSTLLFGGLFTYIIYKQNFIDFLSMPLKNGYWFTIALFFMFFIYYSLIYLTKRYQIKINPILITSSLVLYGCISLVHLPYINNIYNIFCLYSVFKYFLFFIIGILTAQYKNKVNSLLNLNFFLTLTIFIFIICSYIFYIQLPLQELPIINKLIEHIFRNTIALSGIIILFCAFSKYQFIFIKSNKIGRSLQYIGKHTLEIYILHYFFLPKLPQIGIFLNSYNNIIIEFAISIILAILVIIICIIVSNILRLSPFLDYWLWGGKNNSKETKLTIFK